MAFSLIKKKFIKYIINAPLDEKVFRMSCIIFAFALSMMVLVNAIIASLGFWVNVATIASCLLYSILFFLSIKSRAKLRLIWVFIIYTLFLGVFLWFSTNSWQGALPIAFVLSILLFTSIAPRKQNIWVVVTSFAFLATVAFLEYHFPELVIKYPDPLTHLVDVWITIVITILATAIIVYFLKLAYEQEQQRLQEKNEKLEDTQQELTVVSKEMSFTNSELEATLSELQTAQGQLVQSEKLASLGQLTAGIAHELNNPINFISGNSVVLQEASGDILTLLDAYENTIISNKHLIDINHLERVKEDIQWLDLKNETLYALKDLVQGVNRVTEIVKGLQYFSHANVSENEKFDLRDSINSSLIILKSKIKDHNIQLKLDLDAQSSSIMGFPGQLSQVFINLITNAIDAMETVTDKKLHIQMDNQNSHIIIQISDTGMGIPEDIRNKIFDPFFSTKPIGKGTGLGLSISYGIIEKHEGSIKIKENIPQGTRFIIELPLFTN